MNRTAYLFDVLARGFFILVALQLLFRNFFWALVMAVMINLIYELTVGRKFWQAWKNAPKKPRRHWRTILRDLWQRAFCRERTKGLVLAGIVLLIMSYFVCLNIYYQVVAGLVFVLAAISRFAPPTKSATITYEQTHDQKSCPTNCPPTCAK